MCYLNQIRSQIFAFRQEFDMISLLMVTIIMPLNAVIRMIRNLSATAFKKGLNIHIRMIGMNGNVQYINNNNVWLYDNCKIHISTV